MHARRKSVWKRFSEPIPLTHTRTEYEVIPDIHSPEGYEIYSVDKVISVEPNTVKPKEYYPFYSFRHGAEGAPAGTPECFWFGFRRPSDKAWRFRDRLFHFHG